jgi:hypothetical protein
VIDVGELEDSEEADLALNWIVGLPESQDDDELCVLPFDLGSRVRDSVRRTTLVYAHVDSSGSIYGQRCGGYVRHKNREVDAF